jgi:hypothetical protein
MNRRSFLAALGVAPIAVAGAASAMPAKRVLDGEILPPLKDVPLDGDQPFIFEGGQLRVNAGRIRSADGRTVLDMGAGSISFFA